MTVRQLAIPMEVHSQLYIGDYFADTLHFTANEHSTFGGLLLNLWLIGTERNVVKIAAAIGLSPEEWREVSETVSPLFQVAATNIAGWKEALRSYDGKRLPPAEWHVVRTVVLVRDNRTCAYCSADGACHVDHIIAVSRGGSNAFENLTTSCGPCNQSKGPKPLVDWKASKMLDINTATPEEIDSVAALKGHGYEITRYRVERGGFTELRQLDEVPGLSGKTIGIEKFVCIANS
jgi:competence protein ComEA